MNLKPRLDTSLSRWNLLESAFYQAWSAGTLPRTAIAQYAGEYGAFIKTIADGWAAHGDHEIAAEEREHVELWRAFARSLGTDIGEAKTAEVRDLVDVMNRNCQSPAQSLGALYAFEAQQPATSTSKLEGLREHYPVETGGEEYFTVHADDEEEPALLFSRMEKLSAEDQEKAAVACEETAKALRLALDGLYRDACPAA